jgi:hypothetical protein
VPSRCRYQTVCPLVKASSRWELPCDLIWEALVLSCCWTWLTAQGVHRRQLQPRSLRTAMGRLQPHAWHTKESIM